MKRLIYVFSFFFFLAVSLQSATLDIRVSASSDDATERLDNNDVLLTGSTLYLYGRYWDTVTGLRFQNITIPPGATITNAYVEFRASANGSNSVDITISGEASPNPATYQDIDGDISSKSEGSVSVTWSTGGWNDNNYYQTDDISTVIQELIDQSGWASGNSISLLFNAEYIGTNRNNRKRADSYEQRTSDAPLLHIEYTLPQMPPVMNSIPDQAIEKNTPFTLDISNYVTSTNGDPILEYTLTGTLPAGLSFDSSSGVISGTPAASEEQLIGITVTDNDGVSNQVTFYITVISTNPYIELRMDECYWMGGANGVSGDVIDYSGNSLNATSRNKADDGDGQFKICRAGNFVNTYTDQSKSDAVFYPDGTNAENSIGGGAPFSVSTWLYRHNDDSWMAAVIKVSDDSWTKGWGLTHTSGSGANIDFWVGSYDVYARAALPIDTWTHVVGTYDGSTIRIYVNGVLQDIQAQSSYSSAQNAVAIGDDISGSAIDDRWKGNIDELKIWGRALSATEILNIYNNESNGLNYDGSSRTCKPCDVGQISGESWELIGIPADLRASSYTIADLFSGMTGTFNTDWRLYKRIYSSTDNSSDYEHMDQLTDVLEFGQGYWLGSVNDSNWSVSGMPEVTYDSTDPNCVSTSGCVEIALTEATKNFGSPDNDPNDGSGYYRNNMLGYIGLDKAVDWADCRLLIDGTAYTPSDANASGYANKQIWMYNPSDGSADSNGYTTCDDVTPGECKLVPFKGFWVQLTGKTKGHDVKLLVPKE